MHRVDSNSTPATKRVHFMKNSIVLEIRNAEGGKDAKLLVIDMKNIYLKAANNNAFN